MVTKNLEIPQVLLGRIYYLYVVIMYVDICKTKAGNKKYSRVLVRESYRENGKVKKRTIANISSCPDEEIQAIKLALKHKGDLADFVLPRDKIHTKQGLSAGAVLVLHKISQELGIVKALGNSEKAKQTLWMVLARVIEPGSRLANVRLATRHAAVDVLRMKSFNEDDLYSAMDWADGRQEKIEDKLFQRKYSDAQPELFLYDVSSSYLEGTENELAAFGLNRDRKKGKMQIVFGLLTDEDGWPVSVECFKGNTPDSTTFKNQIDKIKHRFGCERITMVGDRGMIKSGQVEDLTIAGFHYITAITKPQIRKLLKQNVIQMELFTEKLCEVKYDGVRYILRKNPVRAKEQKETRNSKIQKVKELLENQNQYLQEHPRAKVNIAKRKVNELIRKLKISVFLTAKFKGRKLSFGRDNDAFEETRLLDGCYVIKSDVPRDVKKETIHQRYKDLANVEDAFRDMKTNLLEVRPVNVRKANRTKAHVFIVMLAYMISKYLREKWKGLNITVEEGIKELSSVCCVQMHVGAVTYNQIPEPRKTAAQLINKLDITLPQVVPHRGIKVATRKKLNLKRKK